jgi:hypothetical protein
MYAPLRRFIIENSFRACVAWHIYVASQSPKGFIGVLKPPPHLAASTDPSAPPPAADPARSTGTHSPDRTTSDPMGTHLHKVRLISHPMVSYCSLVGDLVNPFRSCYTSSFSRVSSAVDLGIGGIGRCSLFWLVAVGTVYGTESSVPSSARGRCSYGCTVLVCRVACCVAVTTIQSETSYSN